jgi:hypothetical protein
MGIQRVYVGGDEKEEINFRQDELEAFAVSSTTLSMGAGLLFIFFSVILLLTTGPRA